MMREIISGSVFVFSSLSGFVQLSWPRRFDCKWNASLQIASISMKSFDPKNEMCLVIMIVIYYLLAKNYAHIRYDNTVVFK